MSVDTARTASDLSAFLGYFVRFVPGAGSPFIEVNIDPGTPSLGVLSRTYAVGGVLYGEYSDGPDIQHVQTGAPWALADLITNDKDGKGVLAAGSDVVHGVATKAALAGVLGLMAPFDSGSGEGVEPIIPLNTHVYIALAPLGSDANDGSKTHPFATLSHAMTQLQEAREAAFVEYLDVGTYPPCSTNIQNGGLASAAPGGGGGTFVFGPDVTLFTLVSSAPSVDPNGVFIPTGIAVPKNKYFGLRYVITASSDPGLVGISRKVLGNDVAGILKLDPPNFSVVPTGTVFELTTPGVVQPIEPGFAILPNGGTRFGIFVELKYSDAEGMFVEIFASGSGSTVELGLMRASQTSGFCGLGVFNTDLEWNGAGFVGDPTGTSFCVFGGNQFDWSRQMAFSGATISDCLIFHGSGEMFSEFTSFWHTSIVAETCTYNANNTQMDDAYPPFGEATLRMGIHASFQYASDVPGLDTISNLAGGSGVAIDIQTNAKANIGGPMVVTASAVGIDVQRGQLSVRPGGAPLTVTAPIEVQVSGVAHPAVDVTTGIGIIDLSTLSSATPGE